MVEIVSYYKPVRAGAQGMLQTYGMGKTVYEVRVDGEIDTVFISRDEAEAYAERLREEAGDANGG